MTSISPYLRPFALVLSLAAALLSQGESAHAQELEEPVYSVVKRFDTCEIRKYDSYLVAETVVEGAPESASNRGFKILAGYIFGNNADSKRMKMTVPVTTAGTSTKMAMTKPVTTKRLKQGLVMQFVMERKYDEKTLPKPLDSRVSIKTVPARTIAAHRYSGRVTAQNFEKHRKVLDACVSQVPEVVVTGRPFAAVYDGPWTLPWNRRNEVLLEVEMRDE